MVAGWGGTWPASLLYIIIVQKSQPGCILNLFLTLLNSLLYIKMIFAY